MARCERSALGDDTLALTASDRISTFDVVLPTHPGQGRVLTGLSAFWFARTREVVPNHLLALREDGRTMVCRKLEMLPIECVVRGYLAGSGWSDYRATERFAVTTCRTARRVGAPARAYLPRRDEGEGGSRPEHRRGGSGAVQRRPVQRCEASIARSVSIRVGSACRGVRIIVADTKFELGLDAAGTLVLGDEALTPDSSRFWPADSYRPGGPQPSFDKQFVRDWCERSRWDKTPPGPELPEDVVAGTRARYVDAFERITEIPFDDYVARPEVVL